MRELGVEEVTVPFDSCHQDLGGKTALGHLSRWPLQGSGGKLWGAMGTGEGGEPGGPREQQPGWQEGRELKRMSGLWRG